MNFKEKVQILHDLAYQTFESGHFDQFRATSGANNQRNEVQFRLMKNIARLNKTSETKDRTINDILADANLAHAMSWMTNETHQKFEEILGSIE
jgi:hypothetical protein